MDGWRGLVNMRDWNDTRTMLFVIVTSDNTHTEETHTRISINSNKLNTDV